MQIIPIILVIALAVGLMLYARHRAAQRRAALSAWAFGHGLSFDPSKNSILADRFPFVSCLRRGHSRYAYNIMEGDWGGKMVTAFDYHYATGSGKNRSDHYFSIVVVRSPIPLKKMLIRREHFLDKVTEFFGMDDIDFESAEFSRKFFVKSSDRRWAYDVIHTRMMEYLLAAPTLNLQFDLIHVAAWNDRMFGPEQFETAVEHVCKVLELLPDYLVRQQIGKS